MAHDLSDDRLLKYLDRRAPRYTSYPTAVQFGAGIGHHDYAGWLEALPSGAAVSLYLHVPFCAELCLYCGCHTTVARQYTPIAAYVELLKREIALVAGITGRRTVTHLHWGGGTPTMIRPDDFAVLMDLLRERFCLAPDAEVAVEIDPRGMTRAGVVALASAGVNRASLGVQDFDARVQGAIRRVQPFEQTARVTEWLREACIGSINVDLMYGLPYQTAASVAATAERVLALEPDRIALFGYAHVPWMKRHQKLIPEELLPGTAERFAQSRAAAAVFGAGGYRPIGLDHFAKASDPLVASQRTGRLHRNFQGYTTDESESLIGLGTSAIGRLPGGYVQNAASTVVYRDAIESGRLATTRGCALTAADRLRRDVIERLMCDLAVDVAALCAAHDRAADHLDAELDRLDEFVRDGVVVRSGRHVVVCEHGRPLVRIVAAAFDAYMPASLGASLAPNVAPQTAINVAPNEPRYSQVS